MFIPQRSLPDPPQSKSDVIVMISYLTFCMTICLLTFVFSIKLFSLLFLFAIIVSPVPSKIPGK